MAVNIFDEPTEYTQSGNPVRWKFSSDQSGQPNFSFIIEVFINDVLVEKHKVLRIVSGSSWFDASEIAERYVNAISTDDTIVHNALNNAQIKIKVIENYGTPPVDQASSTSDNVRVWKSKGRNFDSGSVKNYILSQGTNRKFLTNFQTHTLKTFGNVRLSLISNAIGSDITIKFYESDGTLIKTEDDTTSSTNRIDGYYFTYDSIQTIFGAGTFTDAAYFTVQILNGDFTRATENYRINLEHTNCDKFQNQITFLNHLGGLDTFYFTRMKRYSRTTKTNQFRTNPDVLNSIESTQQNYQITMNEEIVLQSGYVSETIYNILATELITSPLILLNGQRVAIAESSVEQKYRLHDLLFNFEIKIIEKPFTSTVL
jgi:hypothetical protein